MYPQFQVRDEHKALLFCEEQVPLVDVNNLADPGHRFAVGRGRGDRQIDVVSWLLRIQTCRMDWYSILCVLGL